MIPIQGKVHVSEQLDEIGREQATLDRLYGRLDGLRAEARAQLSRMRLARVGGHHQNRSERDAFAQLYEDQLARLESAEENLCFGRLDLDGSPEPVYIGRIGLSDEHRQQLLMDWRAPASEPFYQATPASPGNVVRRRHLTTRQRRVTALEDDVLNLENLSEEQRARLSGEGALMAALQERRTGRMGDIVATIQAEQDRIIRLPREGTVVVQGGPGTGKTAVALHRAAYLLFRHREQIAKSGVLLIGPSLVFLRYIEKVLPSLGETGAVPMTPGQLYPGIDATARDEPAAAALKGDLAMVRVLRRAVELRQRVPEETQVLHVHQQDLALTPGMVRQARERARRSGDPHNAARGSFVKTLLKQLGQQLAERLGTTDPAELPGLIDDVRRSRDARVALNLAWMPLTPQGLLQDLWSKPHRLAEAAEGILEADLSPLERSKDAAWTVEDVPLLDELAELLGEGTEQSGRSAVSSEEREYAAHVTEMTGMSAYVDADQLAARWAAEGPVTSLAERAAEDREWTYGHMIVDEAQDLSPMQLRALYRRVPSKSATLVGDLAQTSRANGARNWADILRPHLGSRFEAHELTVSYRTPAQIMELANRLLTAHFPELSVPRGVREGDWAPEFRRVADTAAALSGIPVAAAAELDLLPGGRLAVIADGSLADEVLQRLRADDATGDRTAGVRGSIDGEIAVLTPVEAKGLEFDAVIVVEPRRIAPAARPGEDGGRPSGATGIGDLYVALTRPTQRLVILGSGGSAIDEFAS